MTYSRFECAALVLCLLSCICAENIPLMAALIISAEICMGLNSQAIQNLSIRKPPLMLRASRAARPALPITNTTLLSGIRREKSTMKNKAGPVLTPAIVGLITDGGDPGMTCMAIEEIRAFALESPERMKLVGKIAAMTAEEFSELLSLMEYCWARVQAGESIEAVVAEWKKEAKGA